MQYPDKKVAIILEDHVRVKDEYKLVGIDKLKREILGGNVLVESLEDA